MAAATHFLTSVPRNYFTVEPDSSFWLINNPFIEYHIQPVPSTSGVQNLSLKAKSQ
jgi:hypothetical protein